MENHNDIKEDDGIHNVSHTVISIDKLMNTHSRAINELLQQISKSYHISLDDAAFAVSNAMNRLSQIK